VAEHDSEAGILVILYRAEMARGKKVGLKGKNILKTKEIFRN